MLHVSIIKYVNHQLLNILMPGKFHLVHIIYIHIYTHLNTTLHIRLCVSQYLLHASLK